jgi:hypothetical protein
MCHDALRFAPPANPRGNCCSSCDFATANCGPVGILESSLNRKGCALKNHQFVLKNGLRGRLQAGVRSMVLGAALAVLAACSSGWSGALPPAPKTLLVADYDHLMGPCDTLNIIVWRNPDLSMSVPLQRHFGFPATFLSPAVTSTAGAVERHHD